MGNTPNIRFKGFTDDWEQRKLGESVSITSGEAPSKFEVGTELYVKVDDLNYNDKYVVDTQNKVAEHSTVKRVTKGSVVFPKRGAAIMTNKVRIMGIDGYMDTNMMALTSEKLDSEFLYNIISKEGLYKIADTSTIPQINNKHVEPYEVTIPSLDEQRKIGAYFKQLDHLITLHQRKGDETKKLKKFMLQKMFPKKDAKKPEIRFAGFTDDWEQRKFADFTWDAGKRNKDNLDLEPYAITNEHGFIRQSEAHDEFGYMKDTDRKAYNIVQPNSFAYNPARINVGSIGYYEGSENVIVSSLYEVFQTDKYVNDRFLWHWLKSDQLPRWIEKLQEGSVRLYFYYDKLCECQLHLPSLEEQEKIAAYIDSLDHLIALHQRKCDELKEFKKYMLQNMFPQKG